MESSANKRSFDENESRDIRSSSIDYHTHSVETQHSLTEEGNNRKRSISQDRNETIHSEIQDSDIINSIPFAQSGTAATSQANISGFISSSTPSSQNIYVSNYSQNVHQHNTQLQYFFNQGSSQMGVSVPGNQQYMNTMVLPSAQPSGVSSIPEIEAIPSSSVPLRQSEDRSIPMNQVEILEDGVMNIQPDLPVDNNLLVSLPTEHPASYEYLNELRNTFGSLTTNIETPNATAMQFKRNNCTVWEYPLVEKRTVKIRLALQEGQVFFDLEDILDGVCGIDVTASKIASLTKSLVPWEEKVIAVQFGDIAFEKEEVFVTYDGLLKLKSSRVSSLHKTRRQYAQTLPSFIQNLTKNILQSFGRECLLLQRTPTTASLPEDPTNLDAIIRAWKYYRMLTDRLELLYAKERVSNPNIFPHTSNQREAETPSKRPRLDSTEMAAPSLLPHHDSSLLPEHHPTSTIIDHPEEPLEESRDQDNNGLSLMLENQSNSVIGFSMSRNQRPDQSNFDSSVYDSIISGNNNVNDTFIDPNPIIIEDENTIHHDAIPAVPTNEENNEDVVWTSDLISNAQSNIKKGKRCPICSNRCGNSSKVCSVCHTPFKQTDHTNTKRYKCSFPGCTMRFKYESQLLCHLRSHQHVKLFTCKVCKKGFATSSSLTCHLRIHNNEKPYTCTAEGCNKSFRTRTQLKQHQLQHTGELPFKCTYPGCNACFRTKRMLEPHLRNHRNEPSPHKCMVEGCGKVFTYRSGLLAHIKSAHDQKFPIHCPEKNCNMQFNSNTQLQEHYERVHRNLTQPQMFESSRLPASIQNMQLPVLPIELRTNIPNSSQPQMMMPVRSPSALRSEGLMSDMPLLPDVIASNQK